MPTPTCIYTPPEGQNIQPYLTQLLSIVNQLNETNNKTVALDRLQLLIDSIDYAINQAK